MPATPPLPPPVIGHRGAAGHAPENTLASIAKAAALGVRWVEFDVRLAADGVPVLFHDETLERTTDGGGPMAAMTAAALGRLDAGSWFGPAFAGERVPTLEAALGTLDRLGLGANVEIKAPRGRAAAGAAVGGFLAWHWPMGLPAPLVSSFDDEALSAAAEAAPQFPRALLIGKPAPGWRERAQAVGAVALHVGEKELTEDAARAVVAAGYALRCYTVNDAARAATLFGWGAEGVISDFPDRIRPPAGGG